MGKEKIKQAINGISYFRKKKKEIEYAKSPTTTYDTGHYPSTGLISWFEHRIRELKGLKEEDEIDYADGYSNEWRKI